MSINSIKTWAEDDRPREKLIKKGTAALSDAELIAILIGSGSGQLSAVDLAKQILASAKNNLNELGRFSINELQKHKGIGEAKSVSIVAALEIGRRRKAADIIMQNVIHSSKDIYALMGSRLGDLRHEEFHVVYLDRKNSLIKSELISVGGVDGTAVDIRKIMRIGLETNASSIIACHNHPSGNLSPSNSDIETTKRLKKVGELMQITLLDHLIVSMGGFYSFADNGDL